jgi:hypothetical protein
MVFNVNRVARNLAQQRSLHLEQSLLGQRYARVRGCPTNMERRASPAMPYDPSSTCCPPAPGRARPSRSAQESARYPRREQRARRVSAGA